MDDPRPEPARGQRPSSPCVNICTLDEGDVCTGCLRTLDEIVAWSRLSGREQWRIVDDLPSRGARAMSGRA